MSRLRRLEEVGIGQLALTGYLAVVLAITPLVLPFHDKGFSFGLLLVLALALQEARAKLRTPLPRPDPGREGRALRLGAWRTSPRLSPPLRRCPRARRRRRRTGERCGPAIATPNDRSIVKGIRSGATSGRDSAWKGRHRRSDRATDRPPPLDPFEPVVLFVLGYGVMFVLRPAAMALRDDRVYEGPRATLDVSAGFTEMLVLALLGAAAFVVGYESGLGRRLACLHKPTGAEPPLPRLARAAVLVGLLGALAFVVALASSGGIRAVGDVIRAGDTADLETGGASMYAWFLVLVTIPATLVLVRAALERRTRLLIAIASAFVALVLVQSVPFRSRITHQSSLPRSR